MQKGQKVTYRMSGGASFTGKILELCDNNMVKIQPDGMQQHSAVYVPANSVVESAFVDESRLEPFARYFARRK